MEERIPFAVSKTESFYDQLSQWIGDVFYDILPESGYELRDEQIYMAFQLEKAFKEKQVMFAEAGVGTGKTIVYLLYSIMYARYTNRPAVIACADETLIEQLVKKEGDIAKLQQILGLNIDVRLAKSEDQYLCLNKLEQGRIHFHEETNFIYEQLPDFVQAAGSMRAFTRYGDRREYPDLPDEVWESVNWDPLQDCFSCANRHRCGLTLNREYYRHAHDLIICSHDFYMKHVWTKESRKREGQLPLLPDHSSVVFDEGHLLEYAAQKALSYRFTEYTLETLLTRLMENDVRERTLHTIEEAILDNEAFFNVISQFSSTPENSEKQLIHKHSLVMRACRKLLSTLQKLEEELVFESELFVINEYDLRIVEEYLEQITYSLSLFLQELNGITWFEENGGERTLVIMPKLVSEVLQEEVFSQKKPYIFSSATLSNENSFDYIASSLGIKDYLSFSVNSPFEYEDKMAVYLPKFPKDEAEKKLDYVIEQVIKSEGRALILLNTKAEMEQIKLKLLNEDLPFPVYFEGDEEISTLVSRFQNEEHAVLCSMHLWEGLDIPGRSLENVTILSLPYPPNDPVFIAKREGVDDPFTEVDLPYMLLRLRQGIGRLIRSEADQGVVHILLEKETSETVVQKIHGILPVEPLEINHK
ncbi:ATP-dependent DNA helicase [Neobacillus dielmonensis]|uniref:ATP-dependent DNA helicase n=1 Tax=Neobacillus dielmonensis TaxID=1347369 RepID=UPI0005AA2BE0|nr:ATP-dependent DNA helicase [Neobacillus dielmonensis]